MVDHTVAIELDESSVGSTEFKSPHVSVDYERKSDGLHVKQRSAGSAVQLQGSFNY